MAPMKLKAKAHALISGLRDQITAVMRNQWVAHPLRAALPNSKQLFILPDNQNALYHNGLHIFCQALTI
jgi:hypothetical protein